MAILDRKSLLYSTVYPNLISRQYYVNPVAYGESWLRYLLGVCCLRFN